ncbi:MAG: TIGR02281 family clan AA aspartic protease [Methyloprofundus sp.]|nr:TIGR02281 family clan AA aspartic protease [Methyloprofundus sp.]
MKPLLFILITFVFMFVAADNLLSRQSPSYAIEHPNDVVQQLLFTDPIISTETGIIISADRRGHYSGVGMINQQKMEFMIDTGATLVAVPSKLAKQVGLQFGMPVISNTAAGRVRAYQTSIPTLQLGSITLKNTHAVILEKLDQVLIGMTVLKKFKVTQFDGKMAIEMP